jgi:maleate cis-trans isomerase
MEGIPVQFADVPKLPPARIAEFIKNEFARHRQAEGVYMLGSAWRTLDIIDELERTLNVPVVHPGPASCWEVQLRLGLCQPIPGYGRLLAEMPEAPHGG